MTNDDKNAPKNANDQAAENDRLDSLDEPRLFAVSDENLPLPETALDDEKFALEKTVGDEQERVLDFAPLPKNDEEKVSDVDAEHFFSEDLPEHIPASKNRGEKSDDQR